MNVVTSVCSHELEMAHRWFDWICELGGTEGHALFLIPSADTNIADILPKANKAFHGNVSVIKDYESQTSDWQNTEPMRSASGPNSAFRQVAWHFYQNKLGHWFWCELDCIPTRKDWLDKLEAEWKVGISQGKPFTGAHVLIDSVPEHMSGNAIYPQNVPELAPTLVMRTEWTPKGQSQSFELAFDIAGAREVVPKAHFTNLIQHKFRYEGFKDRATFDAVIDPNAVVFHSDKAGTIYKYMKENLSGVVEQREVASPYVPETKRALVSQDATPSQESQEVADDPPLFPWQDRNHSEMEVTRLCEHLALFATTPVYKHRVREALRAAKIIK